MKKLWSLFFSNKLTSDSQLTRHTKLISLSQIRTGVISNHHSSRNYHSPCVTGKPIRPRQTVPREWFDERKMQLNCTKL